MRLIKNLFGKKKNTPPAMLSEPAQGAKPEMTPQAWLLELFKRHGLVSTVHDEWVLPNANLPGIRGTWHPGEMMAPEAGELHLPPPQIASRIFPKAATGERLHMAVQSRSAYQVAAAASPPFHGASEK